MENLLLLKNNQKVNLLIITANFATQEFSLTGFLI